MDFTKPCFSHYIENIEEEIKKSTPQSIIHPSWSFYTFPTEWYNISPSLAFYSNKSVSSDNTEALQYMVRCVFKTEDDALNKTVKAVGEDKTLLILSLTPDLIRSVYWKDIIELAINHQNEHILDMVLEAAFDILEPTYYTQATHLLSKKHQALLDKSIFKNDINPEMLSKLRFFAGIESDSEYIPYYKTLKICTHESKFRKAMELTLKSNINYRTLQVNNCNLDPLGMTLIRTTDIITHDMVKELYSKQVFQIVNVKVAFVSDNQVDIYKDNGDGNYSFLLSLVNGKVTDCSDYNIGSIFGSRGGL